MIAVFKREFKSYFISPIGYIFLALFIFFENLFFVANIGTTKLYSTTVSSMATIALFVLPILTMKMLSEDRRQKVDQALLTAPISITAIIMGKFLSALSIFMLAFAPTLIYQIVVSTLASTNWFSYFYSLFGMMLLGATIISVGMFISSLTESSVVAAFLTIFVNFFVMMITILASFVAWEPLTVIAKSISFVERYSNITYTLLNVSDVVYFVSITALFLFLSVRSVERRRWA